MLKKISKVQSFGILNNYNPTADLKPFGEFNVIYGWNGSGKTTLGRLFRCLETKGNHSEFNNAKYEFELSDGSKVNSDNNIHSVDIKVFNHDFINENLNLFEAQTKAIIYISKEKVDEKKEFDEKKIELKKKDEAIAKLLKDKDGLNTKVDKTHQDAGRNIKNFLLGTIYANVTYNKSTSINRIWPLIKTTSIKDLVLTDANLTREKSFTLLNSSKELIDETHIPLEIETERFSASYSEVDELLSTTVSAKVIDRLKENPDISEWVNHGLQIHEKHANENCEFCGQKIPADRIQSLEEHYSKGYTELSEKLTEYIIRLEKGLRNPLQDEAHLLYDELKKDYSLALSELNDAITAINNEVSNWISQLAVKRNNPFQHETSSTLNIDVIDTFNQKAAVYRSIIQKHNTLSKSHNALAVAAKTKIENHFVAQIAITDKLLETEQQITKLDEAITKVHGEISTIRARMIALETDLKSDSIAIQEINEYLHKFLGRNDIALERLEKGGYQLKRDGVVARNLSEGEKTAISLIYFFSKIKENDSEIKNQVIVLDDPISSFDSNHLFNASSFIKKHVNGASQLIVLTHNFWFFKQVRDWMVKKNDKKGADGKPIIVSHIYTIEKGNLKNASQPLTRFHSEYQHVFHTVLNYQDSDNSDDAICFAIANSVRRLLEAFTSFKTPDNSGFNGALQLGEQNGLDSAQKERIHYFLNKYSHLDRIESFDNTVETLLEEGKNVVNDVLWLIKKADKVHYESMLKICGQPDRLIEAN